VSYFTSADRLIGSKPPKTKFLISGLLPELGNLIIVGPPKLGKSFLALDLAIDLAEGKPFLGVFNVPHPMKVALIQAEISEGWFWKRVQWVTSKVQSNGLLPNLLLKTTCDLRLDNLNDVTALSKALVIDKPSVLIIDPLYLFHEGRESEQVEMAKIQRTLKQLSTYNNVATVIVHHFRKGIPGNPITRTAEDIRGSSTWEAWADSIMMLQGNQEDLDNVTLSFELRHVVNPGSMTIGFNFEPSSPGFISISGLSEKCQILQSMSNKARTVAEIEKVTGLSNKTIYRLLGSLISGGMVEKAGGGDYVPT